MFVSTGSFLAHWQPSLTFFAFQKFIIFSLRPSIRWRWWLFFCFSLEGLYCFKVTLFVQCFCRTSSPGCPRHTQLPVQGLPRDHTHICRAQGINLVTCFNESARLGRRAHASLWLYLTRHFVLKSARESSLSLLFPVPPKRGVYCLQSTSPQRPHMPIYSACKSWWKLNISITK